MSTLTTFTGATALAPIYEIMANTGLSGADPFDLANQTIGFTPTGGVGIGPYQFHRP